MNIDNITKAKLFAQYLFQDVVCDATSRHKGTGINCDLSTVVARFDVINRNVDVDQFIGITYKLEEGLQFLNVFGEKCRTFQDFYKSENVKLLLKDVCDITPDHAISVAKIMYPGNDKCSIKDVISKGWFEVEVDSSSSLDESRIIELNFNNIFSKSWGKRISNVTYSGVNDNSTLAVFQFLTDQGYDLPQFLLNGMTMKEAGFATYDQY